eukprot:gene22231-biopygen5728
MHQNDGPCDGSMCNGQWSTATVNSVSVYVQRPVRYVTAFQRSGNAFFPVATHAIGPRHQPSTRAISPQPEPSPSTLSPIFHSLTVSLTPQCLIAHPRSPAVQARGMCFIPMLYAAHRDGHDLQGVLSPRHWDVHARVADHEDNSAHRRGAEQDHAPALVLQGTIDALEGDNGTARRCRRQRRRRLGKPPPAVAGAGTPSTLPAIRPSSGPHQALIMPSSSPHQALIRPLSRP